MFLALACIVTYATVLYVQLTICMPLLGTRFNRPTTDRNYSGEQKVSFESPVLFSKCLRAKIYCNMNGHFDPQGCQTLLLKESELFLLSLGSWTKDATSLYRNLFLLSFMIL